MSRINKALKIFFSCVKTMPIRCFGKVKIGSRFQLEFHSRVRINGNEAELCIGDGVCLRTNTEVYADHGIIRIGNNVFVNCNSMIVAHEGITIGDNVTIGPNCLVYDHDHHFRENQKDTSPVIIKKGAWIAGNVIVLKGVTIGENAVIGAGAIVTSDVPDNTLLIQKKKNTMLSFEVVNRAK